MAQFCVEIPDDKVEIVITSLASIYKYQSMISNPDYSPLLDNIPEYIPNPESIYMFANRMVRNWITENVMAYQTQQAAEQARQQALTSFSLEIRDPQV